jgi:hypothetical protein
VDDSHFFPSSAHVNFHLRSDVHTTTELEELIGIELPNYSLDLAIERPLDQQYEGLAFHSPMNSDTSASVEEKLSALLKEIEPAKDRLKVATSGDASQLAASFYVIQLADEQPHFYSFLSVSTLSRLASVGAALVIEVVPLDSSSDPFKLRALRRKMRRIQRPLKQRRKFESP